jgi:hypothetical protein
MMSGREKSDPAIVAVKPTNKAERSAAEPVEPRAGAEGNAEQGDTLRTPSRAGASYGLDRVRRAAIPPLRRQPPKVGAVCPNWARTDLCGGRSAMSVPTAIRNQSQPDRGLHLENLGSRDSPLSINYHDLYCFAALLQLSSPMAEVARGAGGVSCGAVLS